MKILHFSLKNEENKDLFFLNKFYFLIPERGNWKAVNLEEIELKREINYFLTLIDSLKVIEVTDRTFNRKKITRSLIKKLNSPIQTNIEFLDENLNHVVMSLYFYLKTHEMNDTINDILKKSDSYHKRLMRKLEKKSKSLEFLFS